VRVLLADSQAIFRTGLRKIFALEDDIRVVGQAETLGQALAVVAKFPADVILLDADLTTNPADVISQVLKRAPELRVILLVENTDSGGTVEYFRRGASGLVSRSVPADLLVKCIRKVADGETWLDNQGVNWVLEAYRTQATQLTAPRTRSNLSDKELRIVGLVTQGMKNKDIAQDIGTTEQVIKNYLRKVYDKLGVSDRLELALYCIHHKLLHEASAQAAATAASVAAVSAAAPDSTRKV